MRRLIVPLLFGITGIAILVSLGTWQLQRLEWKRGILTEIEATIGGDPVSLPADPDPETHRYQPVVMRGHIREGELHVLVSRKRIGAGYLIVSPFETESGRRILLDRGFVVNEDKTATRPTGPAQVQGNLHWPDDRNASTPENDVDGNIWFARDIDQMAQVLNTEPILVIARQVTPPDPGVTPLPVDTSGIPNDHLQYAITWFSLALVWLIMTVAYIWRARPTKEA